MNRSRALLVTLLILFVIAAALFAMRPGKPVPVPAAVKTAPEEPAPTQAFLNAAWGMSKAEIEAAEGAVLQPPAAKGQFFTPRPSVDGARYRIYERTGVEFLGRPATVTYVFFDDKLFSYHVFIKDTDGDVLDTEMREYLGSRFGHDPSEVPNGGPLRLVWQSKYLIVNYWLSQEWLTLSQKYSAGFGVVFRPLEEAIGRGQAGKPL